MTSEHRADIQRELKIMGPEAVRRGMVAFEHRDALLSDHYCCFLLHAYYGETILGARRRINTYNAMTAPKVEEAFEGWSRFDQTRREIREELKQECIAFLAEHGAAVEQKITTEVTVES